MSNNQNFSSEDIEELNSKYGRIDQGKENLLLKYSEFNYTVDKAREYTLHGLLRRVGILNRCIHNVFSSCPPEEVERIDDEKIMNITINLQSLFLIFLVVWMILHGFGITNVILICRRTK
ncbi:MAG: hypothetical protein ACK481_01445 [Candidatus Melainabacteria bacterium]|jgi:hypothetical protein